MGTHPKDWHGHFAFTKRDKEFGPYNTQQVWCIHIEFLQELGAALKKILPNDGLVNKSQVAELFGVRIDHLELNSLFQAAEEACEQKRSLNYLEEVFYYEKCIARNGRGPHTIHLSKTDVMKLLPPLWGMDVIDAEDKENYIPATSYFKECLHCQHEIGKPIIDEIRLNYQPGQNLYFLGGDKSKAIQVRMRTSVQFIYIHKDSSEVIREYLSLAPSKTNEWLTTSDLSEKFGIKLFTARKLFKFAGKLLVASQKTCADAKEIKISFYGNLLTFSRRAHEGTSRSRMWRTSLCVRSKPEDDLQKVLF